MSDDADPAQDAVDVRHHAELRKQAQIGRDLGNRGIGDGPILRVAARLEVDDVDLEAGIGEDMADAAPHATGAQCGDPQESRSFSCAGVSDARPSATGQATPAHSHTETRKARPSSTSSRM